MFNMGTNLVFSLYFEAREPHVLSMSENLLMTNAFAQVMYISRSKDGSIIRGLFSGAEGFSGGGPGQL